MASPNPKLYRELDRLESFRDKWPVDSPVKPEDLARAGFFFLEPHDTVECFCCGGALLSWVDGDIPEEEHERHFPDCDFVKGYDVWNIALEDMDSDGEDDEQLSDLFRNMTVTECRIRYPEMREEHFRRITYRTWPHEAALRPDELAQAGFFFTGYRDSVKCFHCGTQLKDWEPGDDPWQEHAKSHPGCPFLTTKRINPFRTTNIHKNVMNESQDVTDGDKSVMDPERLQLLRKLQMERTCKICMNAQVSIVLIPCGHLMVCANCAAFLTECPLCRHAIENSIRTYMV